MGARERERAYCTVNSTVVQYTRVYCTHYRERRRREGARVKKEKRGMEGEEEMKK